MVPPKARKSLLSSLFLLQISSLLLCGVVSASKVISESSIRLPLSITNVITDLKAGDDDITSITTACIITSRGVTKSKSSSVVKRLFNVDAGVDDKTTACAIKTSDGGCLVLANGGGAVEAAASSAVSCGGNIVYIPNSVDLSRGEGLFDKLAPAMERLLNNKSDDETKTLLLVVVDDNQDINTVKSQLEQAAINILPTLVQPSTSTKATVLEDVFDKVEYVSSNTEDELCRLADSCDTSEALSTASSTIDSGSSFSITTSLNAEQDIAAARQLGPAARDILSSTLSTVSDVTSDGDEVQLKINFGELCDAAIKRAMEQFNDKVKLSSPITKQIQNNLKNELYSELGDLYNKQLDILQLTIFDQFKQALSSLKLTPNLPNDMDKVCNDQAIAFTKAAKKLQPKSSPLAFVGDESSSLWSFGPNKIELIKSMKEFCTDRLIIAVASGKFKPLPRKGVTVGMHWLLPKPFGNDYRQEPWMDHTKDNLIYVPKDKITEVSKDDIQKGTGDWRSKIVPSNVGNQIVFMQ